MSSSKNCTNAAQQAHWEVRERAEENDLLVVRIGSECDLEKAHTDEDVAASFKLREVAEFYREIVEERSYEESDWHRLACGSANGLDLATHEAPNVFEVYDSEYDTDSVGWVKSHARGLELLSRMETELREQVREWALGRDLYWARRHFADVRGPVHRQVFDVLVEARRQGNTDEASSTQTTKSSTPRASSRTSPSSWRASTPSTAEALSAVGKLGQHCPSFLAGLPIQSTLTCESSRSPPKRSRTSMGATACSLYVEPTFG